MNFETIELGAGSYPDAPEEIEYRTVKLMISLESYVSVPGDLDDEELEEYINGISEFELLEDTDKIQIEDYRKI